MNIRYIQALAKPVHRMLIKPINQPGKLSVFLSIAEFWCLVAAFPHWCTGSDAFKVNLPKKAVKIFM